MPIYREAARYNHTNITKETTVTNIPEH